MITADTKLMKEQMLAAPDFRLPVPDVAGAAVLLNIGERIGVLRLFEEGAVLRCNEIATTLGVGAGYLADYFEALESAGLLELSDDGYRVGDSMGDLIHAIGFASWTLNANRPFHEHALEFFRSPEAARKKYHRDMHQVAITSQWMGSRSFYPVAKEVLFSLKPTRFVDLGAGSARLLVDLLSHFPNSTGVALDFSAQACAAATSNARSAGVLDRLTIVERSIESIADDPSLLEGADVVHGGFVFHDMFPHDESTALKVLSACRHALQPKHGRLLITDAVPYPRGDHERMFGAAVTFLHKHFMGRRLLSEEEWSAKLLGAAFTKVDILVHSFPSGRLFSATTE
jgi:hypothetical protein